MCMSDRSGTLIADEEEARSSGIAESRCNRRSNPGFSYRAKMSMLRVSARSKIAVYLKGLRRERMLNVHIGLH